jgi:hypothetical protein
VGEWRIAIAAVAVVGVLTLAGAGQAKRAPLLAERAAITQALPAYLRNEPVGCVWLDISVSSNGRFAIVAPVYLNATRLPCLRYAANGYAILAKGVRWKVIWSGSEAPKCALGIPRDLTACRP